MKLYFKTILIIIVIIICLISCRPLIKNETEMIKKIETKKTSSDDKEIISGLIVKKAFVNKIGKTGGFKEFYFRASIQDYFIKFCESKISKTEIENYINKNYKNDILDDSPITLEVKIIKNGLWDICEGDIQEQQSRVGNYMIIYRIIK